MICSNKLINFNTDNVYVIAEIGMNHDGNFDLAKELTNEAIRSGADIVKYQWHIADAETLKDAPMPPYFKGEGRYEYFTRTAFTTEQFKELSDLCHKQNTLCCISVFSLESVELFKKTGADIFKIPSGEVTNIPLLRSIFKTNYPVILSSGMSDWNELDRAVEILRKQDMLCIVQCSSIYPCPPEKVGLNLIKEIEERYNLPVGLSDHTLTGGTAIAGVICGAKIIEKHFTISKKMYGADASFSMEPDEFKKMVDDIRYVTQAINSKVEKNDIAQYDEMKRVFEKSIVVKGNVNKGDVLNMDNIAFKKPGTGISPSKIDEILGSKFKKDMKNDKIINWSDIEI